MAIPSRQIGWSTQSNLLWTISKELERLSCVLSGGCSTTTTTSTTLPPDPFYGTVYWGENAPTACSLTGSVTVSGPGTTFTFCSTIYYYIGSYFPVPTGNIFISDGLGNVKEVYYDSSALIMTSITECTACI